MNRLKYFNALSTPMLGIDVSFSTIKLLALDKTNTGYRINAFGIIPKEKNSQLTVNFKELLDQSFAPSDVAAVAVSDPSVITRTLQTNREYSDEQIMEQIEVEADRLIPFPLEEIYYDFQRGAVSSEDPDQVEVFLAAAGMGVVDSLVESVEEAGLKVTVVDLEQLAVERAFVFVAASLPIERHQAIALFEVQENRISLYVFKDHRTQYYQAHCFIEEILLLQVEHALQAFISAHGTFELDYIVLAGSHHNFSHLRNQVETCLGKKTFIADPFSKMDISPRIDKRKLQDNAPNLLVSLGLALRTFDNEYINLLPWREARRKAKNHLFYMMLAGVICVSLIILGGVQFAIRLRIEKEKINIAYLKKEENLLNEQIKELQALQEDKKSLLDRMSVIQTLQKNRTTMVMILDKIVYLVPEGVFLTDIVKKNKKIMLQGQARTNSEISLLLKNLEEEPTFIHAKLNEVAIAKKEEGLTFKIDFEVFEPDEREVVNDTQ